MLKKFFKLLFFYLLIIITLSSLTICYADEPVVTSETETITTSESEESSTSEQEIYNGDFYLFANDIVMDKLVDGNVFIFGSNVEITGQVNGNLFVLAKTLKFNKSFVRYDIFACANSIYYDGACNDLYVATSNLEMTYDSYVIRDVKAIGTETILKSAIGRDVDLLANNKNFGEGENIPVIYGNLRYTANKEIELPEGIL